MASKKTDATEPSDARLIADAINRQTRAMLLLKLEGKNQRERIAFLANIYDSPAEIAQLVGTTAAVVSQELYELRKAQKGRRRKGDASKAKKVGKKRRQ